MMAVPLLSPTARGKPLAGVGPAFGEDDMVGQEAMK
jgi:hypothetical protein